jgi:cation/acetate symporter
MLFGTFGALILIFLSPVVQVDILHHAEAIFPLRNPGIVTIPGSFLVAYVVSMLTKDEDAAEKFDKNMERMMTGNSTEG